MNKVLRLILPCVLCLVSCASIAQTTFHPVQNTGIYNFLDELAANNIIELNSVKKPYSRKFISESLRFAKGLKDSLSIRQQKELDFFLQDFGKEFQEGKDWERRKDIYYYNDELFTFTVNPILAGEINYEASNASYWRNGIEAWSSIGNWSFWGSLEDSHAKPLLGKPEYLTKSGGGHYKDGTDWNEMRGGLTYSWDWGSAGLVKENVEWGSNYNGANILSGRNPSFSHFSISLKPTEWFEFNYIHGWLNSMVVDSSRSFWVTNSTGSDYREVYHRKNIAANLFSFKPADRLWISVGNSIIYDKGGSLAIYLLPLFFYKSVDHQYSSGIENMNSQMFIDISSRQIKKLHLYATMFIDELSVSRFSKPNEFNFFSYKAGTRLTDFPLGNLSFTVEYTYTYPMAFRHYIPTLTFETNNYNMGHYLKDNSREWYMAAEYRPIRTGLVKLWFTDAIRGPDYTTLGVDRIGNPLIETVEWQNTSWGLSISYQIIHDLYLQTSFTHSNITGNPDWTAPFFYGKRNTITFGAGFGF